MKKLYKKEVLAALERSKNLKTEILQENDIQHLPLIVKKYLRYTGVIGKEKVNNVRFAFGGRIRSKEGDGWMNLKSVQYNFFYNPARIFYIRASRMGIPALGIHLYKDEKAIMVIKLAGLFKVVDAKGPEMDQGETVTMFNDMCCMVPATLIDKNIIWEDIDDLTVNAIYTNGKIKISARLFFNEKGQLKNFISNDRFETTDGKTYYNYPWKTPIDDYRKINGINVPKSAKAIYQHPEGDFCYGEFILKNINYNCTALF